MKPGFANFIKSFGSFIGINRNGGSVLFTTLFYSIWLVLNAVISEKYELHSFAGRMIGMATLENYDVAARVSLFYQCVVMLPASFIIFNLIAYLLFSRRPSVFNSNEAQISNYASLGGILLILFQVFGFRVYETMEAVYFIHKLMLVAVVLKLFAFKKNEPSVYHYAMILSLASALYFLVADLVNIAGYAKNPDFYFISFSACILLLLGLLFWLNKPHLAGNPSRLRRLLYVLSPLLALPLVSILKDELFLVFKANGFLFSGQLFLWLILLTLMFVFVFLHHIKIKNQPVETERKLLARRYLPLFLFSIISYIFYNYSTEFYNEMFESGNRYLALMEFKLFGVIPTLEKFNSHLLSDYFFSSIYSALNGMNLLELELYDFLLIPISFVLYYYLIYSLSRNPFFALFAVFFFPFCFVLLPDGYCFGVIGILVLYKILQSPPSLKNYLLLFTTLTLLIYWRSDLGYSCVVVMPLLLLFYNVVDPKFKINWPYLLKALFTVLGIAIILFSLLSLYRGVNIFYKMLYALNYLSSAQTYGYTSVGWSNQPSYRAHYFVFPFIVGIIVIALMLRFKFYNKTKSQRLAYLSLLFICLYYFANFNRGLIRHSLMEWTDTFTSSYVYIIIPGTVFVLFKNQLQSIKYIVFFFVTFLLITNYALPQSADHKSLFERFLEKTEKTNNINLTKVKNRVLHTPKKLESHAFVNFCKAHLRGDETFIDFTNNPMLYFFTKKITPSYFYQNPLCSHNEFLQKRFVADLADYNTPYLLYGTFTETGYSFVDQVPNSLRHYRIAEHFYNNYSPYILLENFCVWKNNNAKDTIKRDTLINFKEDALNPEKTIERNIQLKPNKKYLARVLHRDNKSPDLKAFFTNDSIGIIIDNIKSNEAFGILHYQTRYCRLKLRNDSNTIQEFTLIESDYLSDFYSEKYLSYNFKKLPYVWGSYDKEFSQEPILFENNTLLSLGKTNATTISIPENLDRTTGNSLIFTVKHSAKSTQTLRLQFGNSKEKNRTTVSFEVLPANEEKQYVIRISSIYKWYNGRVDQISLLSESDQAIQITKTQITKGN